MWNAMLHFFCLYFFPSLEHLPYLNVLPPVTLFKTKLPCSIHDILMLVNSPLVWKVVYSIGITLCVCSCRVHVCAGSYVCACVYIWVLFERLLANIYCYSSDATLLKYLFSLDWVSGWSGSMKDPIALPPIINSWLNIWIRFLVQGIKLRSSFLCNNHVIHLSTQPFKFILQRTYIKQHLVFIDNLFHYFITFWFISML